MLGGAVVATGRFTAVGLLILGPIILNILFFDLFLSKDFNPVSTLAAALALFLLWTEAPAWRCWCRNDGGGRVLYGTGNGGWPAMGGSVAASGGAGATGWLAMRRKSPDLASTVQRSGSNVLSKRSVRTMP